MMRSHPQKEPAAAGDDHGLETESCQLNSSDGGAGKQLALDLLRSHRAVLIAEASRIMVEIARTEGKATTDDVRARMDIPAEVDPRWIGAVPNLLGRKGILRQVGYVKSRRPKAHARPIGVWAWVREPLPGELPGDEAGGSLPVGTPVGGPDRPRGDGAAAAWPARDRHGPAGAGRGTLPLFGDLQPNGRDDVDGAGRDRAGRRRP